MLLSPDVIESSGSGLVVENSLREHSEGYCSFCYESTSDVQVGCLA